MRKIIRLTESDLTRIVKRVVNEDMSDKTGDLYSSINQVIDNFEGVSESDIVMVLENILSHHRGVEGRCNRKNGGYITSDEVRKNFSR